VKERGQPSWDLVETFLAVATTGSLSGAARALGVAQPTARRRLEALEAQLGVVLFTRATTGLVPTEAAERIRPRAEAMAQEAEALARAASTEAGAVAGTVRLTASHAIGVEVLPPILAALGHAHPRLQLEVTLSDRNADLLKREADVAVRMVAPTQGALVARRAATIPLGFFAAEGYLEGRAAPTTLADLRDHVLIGQDRGRGLREALAAGGLRLSRRAFAFRSDDDLAALGLLRAGAGIGIAQVPLAQRDADLVRVLPDETFPLEAWVVMHEDLRASPPIRAVFDGLVDGLGRYVG
jgi:DNA-binding transcriptional LysR family regulator